MIAPMLRRLLRHMEWPDALVWAALLDAEASHDDALTRWRLHHIHAVQWVYLRIWRGKPLDDLPEESAFPDPPSICAWGRACHGEMAAFAASLDAVELDRPVRFPWAERMAERWGEVGPVTLAESVVQVAAHSTYHRGQVNARLRELGGEPPLVDFVAWLWQGRPEAAWPVAAGRQ